MSNSHRAASILAACCSSFLSSSSFWTLLFSLGKKCASFLKLNAVRHPTLNLFCECSCVCYPHRNSQYLILTLVNVRHFSMNISRKSWTLRSVHGAHPSLSAASLDARDSASVIIALISKADTETCIDPMSVGRPAFLSLLTTSVAIRSSEASAAVVFLEEKITYLDSRDGYGDVIK